jgi:hypothetical protein
MTTPLDDIFTPYHLGSCLVCDKQIMADKAYGPKDAGHIEMSFGYGSHAHDVLAYKGFICDVCAMPFREKMLAQTRDRLVENRRRMIEDGVQFASVEDLLTDDDV